MTRIPRSGRITIPAAVLQAAGLAPGDVLLARSRGPGRIELVRTDEAVAEFAGIFDDTVYPPGYLGDIRRGWA